MTRARATSYKPFSACDGRRLMQSGYVTTSLGCIGNRVYTGLGDDEFYAAIPGSKLALLLDKLATIVMANRELESFHRLRMRSNSPA